MLDENFSEFFQQVMVKSHNRISQEISALRPSASMEESVEIKSGRVICYHIGIQC